MTKSALSYLDKLLNEGILLELGAVIEVVPAVYSFDTEYSITLDEWGLGDKALEGLVGLIKTNNYDLRILYNHKVLVEGCNIPAYNGWEETSEEYVYYTTYYTTLDYGTFIRGVSEEAEEC